MTSNHLMFGVLTLVLAMIAWYFFGWVAMLCVWAACLLVGAGLVITSTMKN